MKNMIVALSLMALLLLGSAIGLSAWLGIYHFSQYSEYEGQLEYSVLDQQINLVTNEGSKALSFKYDIESELIIEDFDKVRVSGYYIKLMNLLKVEEINTADDTDIL